VTPLDRSRDRRLLWTGAILLVIGLSLMIVVGEWFAMLDACVAKPTCTTGASPDLVTTAQCAQFTGIGLAVAGAVVAGLRVESRAARIQGIATAVKPWTGP
jgi:hypothetical protein